jgi:hypothetical protein
LLEPRAAISYFHMRRQLAHAPPVGRCRRRATVLADTVGWFTGPTNSPAVMEARKLLEDSGLANRRDGRARAECLLSWTDRLKVRTESRASRVSAAEGIWFPFA